MKALSFSQPWLWAVLDEVADKAVENRTWPPPIEMIDQQIALHAAKSFDDAGSYRLWDLGIKTPDMYAKSAIVGVATIDRIVTEDRTLPDLQKRWYQGPFSPDGKTVYGWILKDRKKLARPISWDGGLGLWTVPPIVENEICTSPTRTATAASHRVRRAVYANRARGPRTSRASRVRASSR